jgi:hypothetical protein
MKDVVIVAAKRTAIGSFLVVLHLYLHHSWVKQPFVQF